MTAQELKNYIDKTLGNNIRCLLPSYWWRRLFGLVVDKIDGVENKVTTNTKNISSVAQNISLVEKKTVQIVNSKNELDDLTSPNGSLASVVTPEKVFSFKDCYQPTPEECSSDEQIAKNFHKFTRVKEVRLFDSAITSYNAFNVYFRSQNIDEYLILECAGRNSRLRYVYKIDGSQGQRTHYLYGTSGDFSSSVESKFNEYLKTNDFRYASSQDSFLISDDLDVLDTICMVCEPESSEVFIKEDEWSRLVKENEAVTTVDLALSDNSTNPVQNKVIKAYLDSLKGTDEIISIPELNTYQEYYDAFKAAGFEYGKAYGKIFAYRSGFGIEVSIKGNYIYVVWIDQFGDLYNSEIGKYTPMKDVALNGGTLYIGVDCEGAKQLNKQFLFSSALRTSTRIYYVINDTGGVSTEGITPLYFQLTDSVYSLKVQINNAIETWHISRTDGSYTKIDTTPLGADTSNFVTKQEVIDNEEVLATALNEMNDKIENNLPLIYTTKDELTEQIQDVTNKIVDNEEITAAALNDLANRIKALEDKIAATENV